jgi:hypothetical protein
MKNRFFSQKFQISRSSLINICCTGTGTGTVSTWAVLELVSYCTEYFFGISTGTGTDWQILVLTHLYYLPAPFAPCPAGLYVCAFISVYINWIRVTFWHMKMIYSWSSTQISALRPSSHLKMQSSNISDAPSQICAYRLHLGSYIDQQPRLFVPLAYPCLAWLRLFVIIWNYLHAAHTQ